MLQVGAMGAYILDAISFKEGAFGATWLTMGVANMAMVGSVVLSGAEESVLLTVLVLLLSSATLALAGACWACSGGGSPSQAGAAAASKAAAAVLPAPVSDPAGRHACASWLAGAGARPRLRPMKLCCAAGSAGQARR